VPLDLLTKGKAMKLFLLAMTLLLANVVFAGQTYGSLQIDEVVSVYDGDTIKVNINELHPIVGEKISVRINGVDTPEIKGKCAQERELAKLARAYVTEKLKGAKHIEIRNIQRGKYFRLVADVYADERDLGELLLQAKLAVPYDGKGPKYNWCKSLPAN